MFNSWWPPWTRAHQASLSFTISQSLPKFMSIESVMLSNHLILYHSLLFCLLSQHRGLFQWVGSLHQVATSTGALGSVLPVNIQCWFPLELTSFISLLSKGLPRVFSSTTIQKHQFFGCSTFIMWAQPSLWSHPYMTTAKAIAWTILTFVSKVMSLLFNTLSRFVIAFLLRKLTLT